MKTFWISFALNGKNLGVCLVDANNSTQAVSVARELKINPGGEALIFEMETTGDAINEIATLGKNRLITPKELKEREYIKLGDLNEVDRAIIEQQSSGFVCSKHN